MSTLDIEVVRDLAAFVTLRQEWDALVARARIDHPFLSHDWVLSWWECFGADNELYVVLVRTQGRLIAIAPLMRTRARSCGLPVRRLEFIANVHTPRFDFIIAERAEEVYAALLERLEQQDASWDILMLPELCETSLTGPALKRLAEARSLRSAVWVAGASPRIVLKGSFDEYCKGLPGKHRTAMRRRMRNLGKLGAVNIEVIALAEDVPSALEDGMRIEASSWKGAAGTAIAMHADLRRFYSLIAERAACAGSLYLLFLRVDGKRIAFAYCLRHERTLYLLKNGYDPDYAPHSPFNVLMYLAIEAACREGLEAIDLLGSEERWKRLWTDEVVERRWFFLHRNSFRALVVYYLKFVILPWLKWRPRAGWFASGQPRSAADEPTKLIEAER